MGGIVKRNFPVLKLYSAGCAANVEKMIRRMTGVVDASVNLTTNILSVTYDAHKVTPNSMREVLMASGFGMIIDEDRDSEEELKRFSNMQYRSMRFRVIGASLLSVPVIILSMFFVYLPFSKELQMLLSFPVLFYFGFSIFTDTWKQLGHIRCNLNTLVMLCSLIAYLFSVFNTFFPSIWTQHGIIPHVYYEVSVVSVLFLLTGHMLEARVKLGNSKAIRKLLSLLPITVRVKRNGKEEIIPIKNLLAGDHVIIMQGERIPADGMIVEGFSYINESLINGDKTPQLKETGDFVTAGTFCVEGRISFVAHQVGVDTMLFHIIQTMNESQSTKKPIQRLVDKYAGYYVPGVLIASVVTFLLWLIIGGVTVLPYAVMSAISLIVISCPCALGLAIPTAVMIGIDEAAARRIIVKDAVILEKLNKVSAVAFDKTGILTEGKPEVCGWKWAKQEYKQYKMILLAAEKKSNHPLASAIVKSIESEGSIIPAPIDGFETIDNKGVNILAMGKEFWVGSHKLLKDREVQLTKGVIEQLLEYELAGWSIVYFGMDNTLLAIIAVNDRVKLNSLKTITKLNHEGIETYMLTGDGERTAQSLAGKVGIDVYVADATPNDKELFIREYQLQGKRIAMVGSGIGDAQALALADVSIAIGHGEDIAMDVAMVTIHANDLSLLARTFQIARRTAKLINRNLFWASIYNLVGIPIAAGVLFPFTGMLLTPVITGGAIALSTFSLVLSSIVIFRNDD